jgi:hypothetical protein
MCGSRSVSEIDCGLGRVDEGRQAFDRAAEFHPVVGRLNSADSMTPLDDPEF